MTALLVMFLLSQSADAGKQVTLEGEAAVSGALNLRRVHITNRSKRAWHRCDVRLPDGKRYLIAELGPGDEEGVMLTKFEDDSAQGKPWAGGVTVTCVEGTGRFAVSGKPPFSDR